MKSVGIKFIVALIHKTKIFLTPENLDIFPPKEKYFIIIFCKML